MEKNTSGLKSYKLAATDGEIGEVTDFYFDDETFTVRYLVVKTGGWLSERKVLVSPEALVHGSTGADSIPVNLTQEQVRTSPDIDTDKPVSRQKQAMLNTHYFWENYWGTGATGGQMGIDDVPPVHLKPSELDPDEDIHLRAVSEVDGCEIHASDGDIGHVSDMILDDQTWKLTSLVVDTHDWIGGKKVLVPVSNIEMISFINSRVRLNISQAEVENSPLYDVEAYRSA